MSAARLLAIAGAGLLVAAAAQAQTPASEPKAAEAKGAEQPPKPRPPLKLRLDDATSAAPRVTFEPRKDQNTEKPGDGLPSLGGERSRGFEDSIRRSTSSPYPPDTNPGL